MVLKELLGDNYKEGMTLEEIDSFLGTKKLVDLSSGDYISKSKFLKVEEDAKNAKKELDEIRAANMTEEQKRQAEQDKILADIAERDKRIARYEMKDKILKNGYTAEECELIMGKDNSPEAYSEVMKNRLEEAMKQQQAIQIKNGQVPPQDPNGVGKTKKLTDYTMQELNELQVKNPALYNDLLKQ